MVTRIESWDDFVSKLNDQEDDDSLLHYQDLQEAGPPVRSLDFPTPTIISAELTTVTAVDHRTGKNRILEGVLMRVSSNNRSCMNTNSNSNGKGGNTCNNRPRSNRHHHGNNNNNNDDTSSNNEPAARAYLLRKKIAKTTYGSIRVAVVLQQQKRSDNDNNNNNNNNNSNKNNNNTTNGDYYEYDDDDEAVSWVSTDELVAIKMSSWAKVRQARGKKQYAQAHLEDPVREVAALQLVGNYHPNVVGCHEVLQDDKHLYTILPYAAANGSSLHSRLFCDPIAASQSPKKSSEAGTAASPKDRPKPHYKNNRPTEVEARDIFRQLLRGLFYLQRKGIFHRDIALENIIISKTNKVKIADLGMSLRVPYSDPCNEGCITDVSEGESRRLMAPQQGKGVRLMYLAPELLSENEPFDGYAADLWSAGVILFVLVVGLAPFKFAEHSEKRFAKIASGGLTSLMKTLKISLTPEACDLLQNMLWEDPRRRLSLGEVMNHPWVMGETMPIAAQLQLQQPQLGTVLETCVSSQESTGSTSVSSTEPTLEMEEMKLLDEGSSSPSKLAMVPALSLETVAAPAAVIPESRESTSEARDLNSSEIQGLSPQSTYYRFPKISSAPKRLMSNAKYAIAHVNRAKSSNSNSSGGSSMYAAVETAASEPLSPQPNKHGIKSPIRFLSRQNRDKHKSHSSS